MQVSVKVQGIVKMIDERCIDIFSIKSNENESNIVCTFTLFVYIGVIRFY